MNQKNEDELFDIDDAISKDIGEGVISSEKEIIEIRDATTEVAKVLVPQFGSDDEYLQKGKIDTRRFSNITERDVWWLAWFDNIPPEYGGIFSSQYCDSYRNHRYSVEAEHKKLSIGITGAVSGQQRKSKDDVKRSMLDKVLGRNKQEQDLYDVN